MSTKMISDQIINHLAGWVRDNAEEVAEYFMVCANNKPRDYITDSAGSLLINSKSIKVDSPAGVKIVLRDERKSRGISNNALIAAGVGKIPDPQVAIKFGISSKQVARRRRAMFLSAPPIA